MAEYISERVREIDGDTYDRWSGTITTGTTNRLTFSNVSKGYSVEFVNYSTTADYTIKLNSTSNQPITIYRNTSKTMDDIEITNIYLSNSSGSSISYEVILVGAS